VMLEDGELFSDLQIEMTVQDLMNTEIAEAEKVEPDHTRWAVGGRGKEDEAWWQVQAVEMVKRWRKWQWEDDNSLEIWTLPNGSPAIEVALNLTFGEQPVKLAIDRISQDRNTGELIVVDIKAGSREPAFGYQLPLYAEAVERMFGVDCRWGAYWMARKGTLTPPKFLGTLMQELDDRFAKARTMIDNEIFLAVPSSFCGSCSVREFCSVARRQYRASFRGS
jgi:CRISPR/Cas system-associated exonuclease Cas4 (RecB family)